MPDQRSEDTDPQLRASQRKIHWRQSQRVKQKEKTETIHKNKLTVLTVTRKGVAAVDVASMVGVVLSEELPGMLRRRPVLSGGDSVRAERHH